MAADDPVAALVALLDDEYRALRRADFSGLPEFAQHKEALAVRLEAEAPRGHGLRALGEKAARNAACLSAAGRGVRAARMRLAELQRAAAGLSTYDRSGHLSDPSAGPRRMERRA